jgi:thioredoxin reductase (NADPH)
VVDVAIVGAGPVGLAAGIEAKRRGLDVLLFDRGTVAETVRRFPRDLMFFSEARKIEIGGHPLVTAGPKPTRREALLYFQKVAEREGLAVHPYSEVLAIQGQEKAFSLLVRHRGCEARYPARYVVVATGYFGNPNRLGVPGEDLPHVHHGYEEAAQYFGCRVAVVGGSNSAVEAALDLYRAGARVTLVHRGEALRPGVKYWLLPDFENRLREGEIQALFRTQVVAIEEQGLQLRGEEGPGFLPVDFVLVLIGYRAADGLLRQAGVAFQGDKPRLSPSFETSVPGLFAIGSCGCGSETRSVFIENGREHARIAMEAIAARLASQPA